MKAKLFSGILAVLLLVTAVNAHALKYDSGNTTTLSAGQSYTFNFPSAKGNFNSAKFSFDVDQLSGASTKIGSSTLTSPASGQLFASNGSGLTYLFTTDFHLGKNVFKLNKFLPELNGNTAGLTLGLLMDRGSITFDSARLRGTVAPEPISMALMAAGMVGLPFARRLKKTIRA
ncbi:hypothetical protein LPW11_13075 [Geomonas sp. RF6]|uniref:hypothetical protein n=1 Tax=Geomonas sp. RF6 TaxID=2897342 RepID=UPI001E368384|nr:hypothetical protein [Geomonas sp. RF6]UFS68831.1 hypothetical protein LPW11_13075 [Geomonas sp. RF6]